MELEELLKLLTSYGVSSYSDQKVKLEFAQVQEQYSAEEDFRIMVEDLQITEDEIN